ncbi:MAG: TrkH family potassium uptake protein [Treponema sp.]|nr:TrkH family potassium uptake protein [Treponema sp.]
MFFTVIRIVFAINGIVGCTLIIPILTALACKEYEVIQSFALPMTVSIIVALIFILAGRKKKAHLNTRSAFAVVALAWTSASLFSAIPLYASGAIPHLADAVFESVSGFSTTGATILSDIESLPRSINLWRCETHWLGGMGIVALTVALLPILGVGGFQLIKAETTGPEKGKLTPKITNTAKILWMLYFGLTVIEAILLKIAGMDFIDALSHAFATLGTGGFSTRNASIASFNSAAIDWILTFFMFFAGINFSMYYYLFTGKLNDIKRDSELKAYASIILVSVIVITLLELSHFKDFFTSLRYSAFQVMTMITTTGFSTEDYTFWHPASQVLVFMMFFIGGSSGSTAGGIKVIRITIAAKQLHNEVKRMLHPHGIFSIRINQRAGRKDIVFNVTAFIFAYMALIIISTFFTTLFGIDVFTSFTASASMIGNYGPAFNKLAPSCNYGWLPDAVKWWYSFIMLTGRLEIYTMIIFFFPSFWKK